MLSVFVVCLCFDVYVDGRRNASGGDTVPALGQDPWNEAGMEGDHVSGTYTYACVHVCCNMDT